MQLICLTVFCVMNDVYDSLRDVTYFCRFTEYESVEYSGGLPGTESILKS